MNQFMPQLMLRHPRCNSTNAPHYKPIWKPETCYVFGAKYNFQIFNTTSIRTQPHTSTSDLFVANTGEVLWSPFDLRNEFVWTLAMGVKGDPKRTSTVIAEKPYMGSFKTKHLHGRKLFPTLPLWVAVGNRPMCVTPATIQPQAATMVCESV
jgi:hypothetical protein